MTTKKEVARERLRRTWPTFSQSLMVSVGISRLGCTDLVFVDPGVEINGAYYRDVFLSKQLLPWCAMYQGNSSSFNRTTTQHTGHATLRLLEQATPAFIRTNLWPVNSPDLNPVDYRIWSVVQQRVYKSRMHNTDELKQCVQQVWRDVDQNIIDNAIDEWHMRLRACVQADTSSICCRKQ